MSAYAKCLNVVTLEIRLVKLNKAVQAMLVAGSVHWARRTRGELVQKSDLLLVEREETWAKLVPYFVHEAEKNGRKHGVKWSNG